MTKYPSWKKQEIKKKWQNLLVAFIIFISLLAIFNLISKSFTFGKILGKSNWAGNSSLATYFKSNPPSIIIYQNDPKRLVALTLDPQSYFETGNLDEPIAKLSNIALEKDPIEIAKYLSNNFGAKIDYYIGVKNNANMDEKYFQELFKNFASPVTPLKIILNGDEITKSTNIAQIDLIKLWWKVKSLRVKDLKLVDLSSYKEEVVMEDNQKVLGTDSQSIKKQLTVYLENAKVINEDFDIKVINASGIPQAGNLAANFATSVGANVIAINSDNQVVQKTLLAAQSRRSYTTEYLANVFNCDINVDENIPEHEINLIVGNDFAQEYF